MEYLLVVILSWILTKLIYSYTALGPVLANIPVSQLCVKTVLCIIIAGVYFLLKNLIIKNRKMAS